MDTEQMALQICQRAQGKSFLYQGELRDYQNKTGYFEVLEDCNCCCPTNTVLFSFQMENSRYVMQAEDMLAFYEHCTEI